MPTTTTLSQKNRLASGTHDPEKWRPVFGQDHAHKKGSGAPKGALSSQCPRYANKCAQFAPLNLLRGCATSSQRRARLSALTLAALATGYHPDGSAPEPGFLEAAASGVLPAMPQRCVRVKHAPCRPVFLPVDRGPRAARVRIGNSARGDRPSLRLSGMPSGQTPFGERVGWACNVFRDYSQAHRRPIGDTAALRVKGYLTFGSRVDAATSIKQRADPALKLFANRLSDVRDFSERLRALSI
jgi:hypothetical protein